jgi:GNAT superfamily N-acetyltransferase
VITLRESGADEAETLMALQRAASVAGLAHIFPPEQYPYPDAEVLERWRQFTGRVVVAEREGTPVGLAATESCWLHGLYVIPEEWGGGVAATLHDAALDRLREDGCAEARLWVLEDNRRARAFYERRGWRLVEETRIVPYPPHPIDVSYALSL